MKTCYKCQHIKAINHFAKDSRAKDGYQPKCKQCDANYRSLNATKISEYKRLWNLNPSNDTRAKRAAYKRANPRICNALKAKRKAAKLKATPKWLTDTHLAQIKLFYEAASALTVEAGVKFEVDHIMPLQGKNSCGLHVPWNLQVITAEENHKKGNRV